MGKKILWWAQKDTLMLELRKCAGIMRDLRQRGLGVVVDQELVDLLAEVDREIFWEHNHPITRLGGGEIGQ